MKTNKNSMLFLIPLMSILLLSSCSVPQKPVGFTPLPDLDHAHRAGSVAKRFGESVPQGPTAAGTAIELSEKYAKLADQAAALRMKNQDLTTENNQLKGQVVALDAQLQQTQKELTEANDLLRERLIELNNWKTNVIGFREEIRGAEKAQLQALLKILKVLGGEVRAESVKVEGLSQTQKMASGGPKDTGSAAVSAYQPAQPQSQKTPAIGEPNE